MYRRPWRRLWAWNFKLRDSSSSLFQHVLAMSHYIHDSCIVPLGVHRKEKREKLTFPFRSINKTFRLVAVLTKNHHLSTMNLTFTHLSIEPIFIGFNNNFQNSLRTYVCVILRYTLKSSPSPHPSHNYHVSWLTHTHTKYQSNFFLILMMRWCDKWGVCGKFQPVL